MVDDLDDLVAKFDAVQAGVVERSVRVTIAEYLGDTDPRWPGHLHRRIFLVSDRMRVN